MGIEASNKVTHRTSIFYCTNCFKFGHGEKVGWMESTSKGQDVNVVVSGPINAHGDTSLTVEVVEREDIEAMPGHSYTVIECEGGEI